MYLIWGIKEHEYKPELYAVPEEKQKIAIDDRLLTDDYDSNGRPSVIYRRTSTFFMNSESIEAIKRFYGIERIYHVIGTEERKTIIW